MKHLLVISLIFILPLSIRAQQGLYIAPDTRLQVSGSEPVGIYGNVSSNGAFGTSQVAMIHFYGKTWNNGSGATFPDESTDGFSGKGGLFRFSENNPLYGSQGAQQLFGGYSVVTRSGSTFPNFAVNNRLGILLSDLSDMKVRNNLHFMTGHIFLNGWNLVVGDRQPGSITGYSEQAFVVTGSNIAGGFLYREQVDAAAGKVVFPIGTSTTGYAPAALEFSGAADDFKMRVFDSVYQFAISGPANRLDFTNKTWNIAREHNNNDEAKITLQHMNADEGTDYASFRGSSYLSRYINNAWDYLEEPDNFPLPGNLTTTNTLRNATMHYRVFPQGISSNEYFAKSSIAYGPYAPAVFLDLNAWRLSEHFAQLEWAVSREMNNDRYEIERRFDRDTAFTKTGEVRSAVPGGNTNVRQGYRYADANSYDGWTYYRIRAVSRNGRESYSRIKAVPPFLRIEVWPNPSSGHFNVRVRGEHADMIMQIMNMVGQVVNQYAIQGEGDVRVNGLAKGTYLLVFYDKKSSRLMRTHKVTVIDRR